MSAIFCTETLMGRSSASPAPPLPKPLFAAVLIQAVEAESECMSEPDTFNSACSTTASSEDGVDDASAFFRSAADATPISSGIRAPPGLEDVRNGSKQWSCFCLDESLPRSNDRNTRLKVKNAKLPRQLPEEWTSAWSAGTETQRQPHGWSDAAVHHVQKEDRWCSTFYSQRDIRKQNATNGIASRSSGFCLKETLRDMGVYGVASVGSAGHEHGSCRPCDFVHRGSCRSGIACQFCHLCPPGEALRRKKERRR